LTETTLAPVHRDSAAASDSALRQRVRQLGRPLVPLLPGTPERAVDEGNGLRVVLRVLLK
jgi:hypothetical protein